MDGFPQGCPCGRKLEQRDDGFTYFVYWCDDCDAPPPPVLHWIQRLPDPLLKPLGPGD